MLILLKKLLPLLPHYFYTNWDSLPLRTLDAAVTTNLNYSGESVVTFHGICNFHDVSFHIYLILSNFNLIISPFVYLYGVTLFDK